METKFFIERKGSTELPLLDKKISIGRLAIMIIGAIAAFIASIEVDYSGLRLTSPLLTVAISIFMPLIVFLVLFHYVGQVRLRQLFGRVTWRNLGLMLVFFVINYAYNVLANISLSALHIQTSANAGVSEVSHSSAEVGSAVELMIQNLISLLNEELFATLLLLTFSALFYHYSHLSRNASLWLGLIISLLLFGLAHYKAYAWNPAQILFLVPTAHILESLLYIRTRSLWMPFIMHYLWDTFSIVFAIVISMVH